MPSAPDVQDAPDAEPPDEATGASSLAAARLEPEELARLAGLTYVRDSMPGIARLPWGRGFTYRDPRGETVTDREERRRFESLVIPPGWTDVWICPDPEGHLQATGRDARGRKQYRYHPLWEDVRRRAKFSRIIALGVSLPRIRRRVGRDLALEGLPRDRVLAATVRLLDRALLRVGNAEYARANESYGITTLRERHVEIGEREILLEFRGKSGKEHQVTVRDPELLEVVKACCDVPGWELFKYLDDGGRKQTVEAEDVNEYLRRVSRHDLTAKDFRTWAGTVRAVQALRKAGGAESDRERSRHVTAAVKEVAEALGNEPATCRAFYIHPGVLRAYEEGRFLEMVEEVETRPGDRTIPGYRAAERTVLALLPRLEGLEEEAT